MTKISTIETGIFESDGGAMFGLLPKSRWSRHYYVDNKNLCKMAMRCLLFKKNERIFLFDTGVGCKSDKKIASYGFSGLIDLRKALEKLAISPDQITDIILSHLHFDHCGGLSYLNKQNILCESFPNATYHISRKQWLHHLRPDQFDRDSYFFENTYFLIENPRLNLIDSDICISPEIELNIYDGHTPGQLVSFIKSNQQTYVFAGDVVPLALNLEPISISAYDQCSSISLSEKIRLLNKVVEMNGILVFYHDTYTSACKIKKTPHRFIATEMFSI